MPPSKDQPWTEQDWVHWAYYLGLKLDWHSNPFGVDNRLRIEQAVEQFRHEHGK